MDDVVPFGSQQHGMFFVLLLISRGMDLLSTWAGTPNLGLEGNPVAKKLGWRWGIVVNFAVCLGVALLPLTAIAMSTFSFLVAARNFQNTWLMRSMGEEACRNWHAARLQETPITLFLISLAGDTLLTASVGVGLVYFSSELAPYAIGMGIIAYAVAVAIFTLLAVWRMRRATERQLNNLAKKPVTLVAGKVMNSGLTQSMARENVRSPDQVG